MDFIFKEHNQFITFQGSFKTAADGSSGSWVKVLFLPSWKESESLLLISPAAIHSGGSLESLES